MRHYNYIVLTIQDLATSKFVHSVIGDEPYSEGLSDLSEKPLQYFVKSDDVEGLLQAKEIMENACNSIYEVQALIEEGVEPEDVVEVSVPAYVDNFVVYNHNVNEQKIYEQDRKTKLYWSWKVKKLHKNRFQVIETFSSTKPETIELYD